MNQYVENLKLIYKEKNVRFAPLSVSYEITRSCNLKCKHCYNQFTNRITNELNLADKKRALDKLLSLGVVELIICGGEPMVSPHFCEVVRYAKQLGFQVVILTNALALDDNTLAVLNECLFVNDTIQVSFDELPCFDVSQRNLSDKQYTKFEKNIKSLQKINCFVYASITPTKLNQMYIKELFSAIKKLSFTAVGITPYKPFGGKDMDELRPDYSILDSYKQELQFFCDQNSILYYGGIEGDPCECIDWSKKNVIYQGGIQTRECEAGRYVLHLSCEGNLYPCVFMEKKEFAIGHIFDSLEEIKLKTSEIVDKISVELPHKCLKCSRLTECNGGCIGLIYDRFESLKEIDPRCNQRINK